MGGYSENEKVGSPRREKAVFPGLFFPYVTRVPCRRVRACTRG